MAYNGNNPPGQVIEMKEFGKTLIVRLGTSPGIELDDAKTGRVVRQTDDMPVDLNDIRSGRIVPTHDDPDAFSISIGQSGFAPRDVLREWIRQRDEYPRPFTDTRAVHDRNTGKIGGRDKNRQQRGTNGGNGGLPANASPIGGQRGRVVTISVKFMRTPANNEMIRRIADMLHTVRPFNCDRCPEIRNVFIADVTVYHFPVIVKGSGRYDSKMTLHLIDMDYGGAGWSAYEEYRSAFREDAPEDDYTRNALTSRDATLMPNPIPDSESDDNIPSTLTERSSGTRAFARPMPSFTRDCRKCCAMTCVVAAILAAGFITVSGISVLLHFTGNMQE